MRNEFGFNCALSISHYALIFRRATLMNKDQLAKMIAAKIDAALNASEHPKKFFITANGRGVTDGGDLYNALLKDVLGVVSVALTDIIFSLVTPAPTQAPAPAQAPTPAPAKATEKSTRTSLKK